MLLLFVCILFLLRVNHCIHQVLKVCMTVNLTVIFSWIVYIVYFNHASLQSMAFNEVTVLSAIFLS